MLNLQQLSGWAIEADKRLVKLEADLARTLAAISPDVAEVGAVCRKVGLPVEQLHRKTPDPERVKKVQAVFLALRKKGWSIGRIARATTYSTRGVQVNLKRQDNLNQQAGKG